MNIPHTCQLEHHVIRTLNMHVPRSMKMLMPIIALISNINITNPLLVRSVGIGCLLFEIPELV